jgi:hypothetical protein
MRFPRIIRPSEGSRRLLLPLAEAGEWAVTGAFRFAHRDPAALRQAEIETFKHGWLGLTTFGSARLVEVAEIARPDYEAMTRRLAAYFLAEYGVTEAHEAIAAAEEEMAFASSLCDGRALKTVLALDREFNEQGLIETTRLVD